MDQDNKTCLCVLFNHPFTANIPLLRRMYEGRFSHVRFFVPFVRTDEPDVLPCYRGSFAHHAFVGEHLPELEALGCSRFVLIHDDILLSPQVNEDNIAEILGLKSAEEGFMGVIGPPPRDIGEWGLQFGSLWRLMHPRNYLSGTGVESLATVLAQLPPHAEAARIAEQYSIPAETQFEFSATSLTSGHGLGTFRSFGGLGELEADFMRIGVELLFGKEAPASLTIPYPIAWSGPHADLCVVPESGLKNFAHIGGVLAAAGLFVEMASPTALMLSCSIVRGRSESTRQAAWNLSATDPRDALEDLRARPDLLAIHPVKLSVIRDQDAFAASVHDVGAMKSQPTYRDAVLEQWPDFDAATYLQLNPDVRLGGGSAYEHFVRFGVAEGRRWH